MSNPKKQLPRRTDEDWYRLIMDCRKSGLSDAQFCRANGIPNSTFATAVKRLRDKSFAIPEVNDIDAHDLTLTKQDVVKVDIISDIRPHQEPTEVVSHSDNSHMIEIKLGDVQISLCNGADTELVARTLSALRSFV